MTKKLPGRRSKTSLMTEAQKEQESKFGRCPANHALPHRTNKGSCTPLFCAGSSPGKKEPKKKTSALMVKETISDLALAGGDEADEASKRIAKAETRHRARMSYVKFPKEFESDKARDVWMEAKKKELAALAMADVEFSLKLGDGQEREKARDKALDMAGHGRKEAGQGNQAPLMFIVGLQEGGLPWIRRTDKEGKELVATTVTASVTDAKK